MSDVIDRLSQATRMVHAGAAEVIGEAMAEIAKLRRENQTMHQQLEHAGQCLVYSGANIKRIRREKKLTLKEVAARAGLAIGHVWRIENNARFPRDATLLKVAAALGVHPSAFSGVKGDK